MEQSPPAPAYVETSLSARQGSTVGAAVGDTLAKVGDVEGAAVGLTVGELVMAHSPEVAFKM